MIICYSYGLLFKNYSTVDRLWSITPIIYSWIFTINSKNENLYLISICITLWGLRLSFNFYRKGGYNLNEEDYRWKILK